MKITIDTNVMISGTFWEGEAYQILQLIEHKKVQCFLSEEILKEIRKLCIAMRLSKILLLMIIAIY